MNPTPRQKRSAYSSLPRIEHDGGSAPRMLSHAPPKNKSEGFALASLLHLQIIIRLQTIKIGSVQYMLKTIELIDIFFRQFVLKW